MVGQGVGEVGGVVAGIEQDQPRRVVGLSLPGHGQVFEQPGDLADRDVGGLLAGPQPARLDGIGPGGITLLDTDEQAAGPAGQPVVPALATDLHQLSRADGGTPALRTAPPMIALGLCFRPAGQWQADPSARKRKWAHAGTGTGGCSHGVPPVAVARLRG
jgi:hypothetical protein